MQCSIGKKDHGGAGERRRRSGGGVRSRQYVGSAAQRGAKAAASAPPGLMTTGTLVVGMDLQFKPEMYLKGSTPAGL